MISGLICNTTYIQYNVGNIHQIVVVILLYQVTKYYPTFQLYTEPQKNRRFSKFVIYHSEYKIDDIF